MILLEPPSAYPVMDRSPAKPNANAADYGRLRHMWHSVPTVCPPQYGCGIPHHSRSSFVYGISSAMKLTWIFLQVHALRWD